jgi:hypothetical protein
MKINKTFKISKKVSFCLKACVSEKILSTWISLNCCSNFKGNPVRSKGKKLLMAKLHGHFPKEEISFFLFLNQAPWDYVGVLWKYDFH